jgi:hypothetical protein
MVTEARLRSNWRQKQRTLYLVFRHPRRQTFAEPAARLPPGAIRGRSATAFGQRIPAGDSLTRSEFRKAL